MKSCYIHSAVSISAQPTFEEKDLFSEMKILSGLKVEAMHPNYKEYISPIALRRMATGVKMGVATATKALQIANLVQPDAILTGTGMGCIEDTEIFLNAIIANEEEFLTPTSFIQSTHNTVGAQIALGLQCNSYNNTYVHGALSFESALIDGKLLIQQEEANHLLVGGIDELGNEFVDAVRMMEDKDSDGIKIPLGEGASFFVLSSIYKQDAIELLDLESFSSLAKSSLSEKVRVFLTDNNLSFSDIDILMLGKNGDRFDTYYDEVRSVFSDSCIQVNYKQWSGEFYTASAFGMYLGCEILKSQRVPEGLLLNKNHQKPIKTILLYNQFKGRDHSFMLMKQC